ncbi:hypothetical protein ABVK25_003646 [Lepraria finkii]|uniref:Serine hydrolase domain-containing protein n=1 Tax=Lepraria finkii TaxID=1340010 RepID=A0ABR4BDU2_9LECA
MSASVSTSTTISSPTTLKILMLHGFTQSSSLFNAKTRALHKALTKAFPPTHYTLSLTYPCAPHKLPLADIPDFNPGGPRHPHPRSARRLWMVETERPY